MKHSNIKSISYVKSHSAEILENLAETQEPYIITQNGEARAVLQDVKSYEETQETLALLKILALGERQVEQGETYTMEEVIRELRLAEDIEE